MCNFLFGGSMAFKLNKAAYQKLIDEDIKAVRASSCEALEREHIVDVLRHSVECYYPSKRDHQLKAIEDWAKENLERFGTAKQEEWTNSAAVLNALQMLPGLIAKFLEDTAPKIEYRSPYQQEDGSFLAVD
jgi:hypothetical protein